MESLKKIIKIVFVLLLIGIILISIFLIFKDKKEENIQEDIFEEIIDIAKENTEEKQEDTINMKELYKINNHIVGWIKIENTNIDYPVMQTKENPNYYLKRNFYKQYSILGTPYIAENCNIENSDNLIMYGHHINGNKMFGELENYKSKEYYNNHKIIKFYTMKGKAEYEIIAVFRTVYTDFQYYKFYDSEDEREFKAFINKCKELSFYDIEKTAVYRDKLITLSTCEYSNQNGRLVVVAKKTM